jgi:isochorismate synthase
MHPSGGWPRLGQRARAALPVRPGLQGHGGAGTSLSVIMSALGAADPIRVPQVQSRNPMLAPFDTADLIKAQLMARLGETIAQLPLACPRGFASLTLELPYLPGAAPALAGPHFSFSHAHREDLRAGYGIVGEWRAAGPDRLRRLRTQALRLKGQWHQCDPDETGVEGFTLLGFAAAPGDCLAQGPGDLAPGGLPEALLWLPELALRRRRGQAALVLTTRLPADPREVLERWTAWLDRLVPRLCQVAPGPLTPAPLERRWAQPDQEGWAFGVGAALEAIARGHLDKVVLTRRLGVQGSRPFDLERLVSALAYLFPACQVVKLRRDGQSFIAATPERLLAQRGNLVEVDAIAGTAARAAGSARDAALGEALLSSPKELHEHALVTQALCAALAPHSRRLEVPDGPRLLRLNNAQHLWTPIRAELEPRLDALALADLLHPTPATNGQPSGAASAWLSRAEPQGRGWYTGAAGCLEPDVSGELWVLLRCAEIDGDTALLHAGAGIVCGSEPASEWRETEDKLAAMLTALQFA